MNSNKGTIFDTINRFNKYYNIKYDIILELIGKYNMFYLQEKLNELEYLEDEMPDHIKKYNCSTRKFEMDKENTSIRQLKDYMKEKKYDLIKFRRHYRKNILNKGY
jgi:hypothetical protein